MEHSNNILTALNNSLVADAQKLKDATTYLTDMRVVKGYCLALMDIVDQGQISVPVKQAALIQLKNTIKLRWNSQKLCIDAEDKQVIRNTIITAIIRCSKDHKLVKIYKDVLTIIISHQYKTWMPIPIILQKLNKNEDLVSILHCIIAIAASFQFSLNQQQRKFFFEFIKVIIVQLVHVLTNNNTSELIYLVIKFLWKAFHYEVSDQIKILALQWMQLIGMIVCTQNQNFDTNKKVNQYHDKNSSEFYYFHTKKWATRILLRFIQKHAKLTMPKKAVKQLEYSRNWYQSYGNMLINAIFQQLSIPNHPKVRFHQFKCIQATLAQNPQLIESYAEKLQYQILLPYLRLRPEDQQLANSDPVQFLNRQQQPCINFTNLKKVATQIWTAITQLGCKQQTKKSKYEPGPFFYKNLAYLQKQLQSTNPIQKQLAMYLLCAMRFPILKCSSVKQKMPELIYTYIIPEFKNEIMFLRARAVDIFYQYSKIQFNMQIITKATQGIYICLTQDAHMLVRIKAASAFNSILRHKSAKQLVRPILKDILSVYLKLLEQYDLQCLISSLESIVEDFNTQIQPFAGQLIKYLFKNFTKLFQKDAEQNNNDNYGGELQLAASGCLKTIGQIIDAPLTRTTIDSLKPDIITICCFIFDSPEATQYIQDLLGLLHSYLYKVSSIGPELWFFYQVLIYNITGIPKQLWLTIQNSPLNNIQKNILKNVKGGGNTQLMQQTFLVLRIFVQSGLLMQTVPQNFKANFTQLLFFLITHLYKAGVGNYSGQLDMLCGASLLINFLENYPNATLQIAKYMWQLSKYNIAKCKAPNMKLLTIQLISMLFYRSGQTFLNLINSENEKMIDLIVKQFTTHQSKLSQQHQYQRMILGLSRLITIKDRNQRLLQLFPIIFKLLIKFVKHNAEVRLKQEKKTAPSIDSTDTNKHQLSHKIQQSDEENDYDETQFQKMFNGENIDDQDEDDEDFWEQSYGHNYWCLLNEVDEIKYFENCIMGIQSQQPGFYAQICKIIPNNELAQLDTIIKQSIQIYKPKKR